MHPGMISDKLCFISVVTGDIYFGVN